MQGEDLPEQKYDTIRVDSVPFTLVLSNQYPSYKFKYDGYKNDKGTKVLYRKANDYEEANTNLLNDQNGDAKNYLSYTDSINHEKICVKVEEYLKDTVNFEFMVVTGTKGQWKESFTLNLTLIPPIPADTIPKKNQDINKDFYQDKGDDPDPIGIKLLISKVINHISGDRLIRVVLFPVIFLLFVFLVALSRQQKKIVKFTEEKYEEMRVRLEEIKSKTNNSYSHPVKDVLSDSSKEKMTLPSKDDLLRLVSSSDFMPLITKELETITESDGFHQLISECVTKAMRENNAQNDINVEIHSNNDVQGMAIHTAEYDNVVYDAVTNTFSITDNVPYRLFRIIEREGEYFFTLVDDPNVHKELFGVLGIYKQCTEVIQESSNPSTVDVADGGMGQLSREGDIFRVSRSIRLVLR